MNVFLLVAEENSFVMIIYFQLNYSVVVQGEKEDGSIRGRHEYSDGCVFLHYSQVGKWRQVFEGSLWYQRYVVTMERPDTGREEEGEREEEGGLFSFVFLSSGLCDVWCWRQCVLGQILTANVETWVRRRPSLGCSAGGCSSGFFTHRTNMLAWRQMQKSFSRCLQTQQSISEHRRAYYHITMST